MHRRRRGDRHVRRAALIRFDRVYGGEPRFSGEAPWSRRLALRLLRRVAAARETVAFGRTATVVDAAGESPVVFVCADPEALVPPASQESLLARLDAAEVACAVAVSNESEARELRRAPACAYSTPSALCAVAELMAPGAGDPFPAPAPRMPVYAVRRDALSALPPDCPLGLVPSSLASAGRRVEAVPRAFVHRYGAMDASPRSDLAAKVPPGARRVLDVGCSQAATAPLLRERGVAEVWGIEPDPEDAAAASSRCDRVVAAPLEEVDEAWEGKFDAILFGDVLEHLEDPARALVQVRPWLSPRGVVVASVPNWGCAPVIEDLLAGRFDYIPYSILSGTHLRLFTRRSLAELLEACGYAEALIEGVEAPLPPRTEALRRKLLLVPGASRDLSALELLAVARPGGGG